MMSKIRYWHFEVRIHLSYFFTMMVDFIIAMRINDEMP